MLKIDNTTYAINEINRYKTLSAKTQIVLATSLRKENYHITRLLHKDFGKSKRWNTYSISRDGTVYQHYEDKYHSDFLGIKEADKQSISIVLENMGTLFQVSSGKYVNWLNEVCDEDRVQEKSWVGYNFWEILSESQIESAAELCKLICTQYNIPKVCMDFSHYHKDTLKFRGIVFRSNYVEDSSDINPLFNIEKFGEMLRKE
jgi:N-acetyl-anhydromuramyl-L-alanine amidase AmpD